MNNDDKIRDYLNEPEIPEELEPERIREMLEKQAPVKKRAGIKRTALRVTAGAAACAVVCGGTVALAGKNGLISRDGSSAESSNSSASEILAPYMAGASDYAQVYELFEKSHKKYQKRMKSYSRYDTSGIAFDNGDAVMEEAEESYEAPADAAQSLDIGSTDGYGAGPDDEAVEFSDTHDQEEGVREADKVKTNGKYIYYLTNSYGDIGESRPILRIAEADNGAFAASAELDLIPETDYSEETAFDVTVFDMYIYDDMIAVIGNVFAYPDGQYLTDGYYYSYDWYSNSESQCFVSFYTVDLQPELIGTYFQDGSYHDVRISPDGYMYLLSDYTSAPFESVEEEEVEMYIPTCGTLSECQPVLPEDILMPDDVIEPSERLSYTLISSIDLNTPGEFSPVSQKALAGYTGQIYCSADNLYTAVGWEDTDITRIAIGGGQIEPMASGTVEGYVNDQFSMSEYGGYFRVATTRQKWDENGNFITDIFGIERTSEYISDNLVYVLDLDLNVVGSIDDFGNGETIKSVSFSGDMAYVVTYEQTDPLFAIDLTDPAAPTITDSFQILGYSTYMEKWDEGLLFGFGADADENGIETGVKAVMFDNSDPADLQEVGKIAFNNDYDPETYNGTWVGSVARWDRKALLIAPEKNLIGIPLTYNDNSYDEETGRYGYRSWSEVAFLAYEEGDFTLRASLDLGDYVEPVDRVIYIGDYIYALSGDKFTAIDYYSLDVTDTVEF
ncbi:MAG: beta-propeller domain-containing protein [Ruminococcus sp.]|nr:beta-propeller domain-containing protein [Ruminococcus sp.]